MCRHSRLTGGGTLPVHKSRPLSSVKQGDTRFGMARAGPPQKQHKTRVSEEEPQ